MKWVWDESAGQYMQVSKVNPATQQAVTDKEDIAYLNKRKKQFDEAKQQVMDRLQQDIDRTSTNYNPENRNQKFAGAGRAFTRMAYYKSSFMKKDLDRFSPDSTNDEIMNYGLVDSKLVDYFDSRDHSRNIQKAFKENKDLLSFEKFNPQEVKSGSYGFMEKMDKAMPESTRMRTLSECLDKMIDTNGVFFTGDVPEFKKLVTASKKLKNFIKKNPGVSANNEEFQKVCKEVNDAADNYQPDNEFKKYLRVNYLQRQGCKYNLKNAISDVLKPTMPEMISNLKEEERKQNERRAQEQERMRKAADERALNSKKEVAARTMATILSQKSGLGTDKKFIEDATTKFKNSDWFKEATKDWTAEDARTVDDPNYTGPVREKFKSAHNIFTEKLPSLIEEVKQQKELEKQKEAEKQKEIEKQKEAEKQKEIEKQQKAVKEITPEERINRRLRRLAKQIAIAEAKRKKIPEDDKYQAKIAEMSKKIQKTEWFQEATKNAAASGLGVKAINKETKEFVKSVYDVYNKEVKALAKSQTVKNNTKVRQNNNPQKQSSTVRS